MSIRLLTCVWIAGLVQAQNPCRVNIIFSLEASTYVNSEGESIVYDQISKVQSAYQSWTISPNSVRAALPKPIGCTQGGNWNLQNDTNSLNNVVSSVKRFLYTCFQPNSLSDYITSLNNQILQSQSVDPAIYVFVIFTATTDTNDVQKAISLRTQFFDPKGYGLVVVKVEPQTAFNLAQLATNGVYDLGNPIFTQDISSAVCNGKMPTGATTLQPTSTSISQKSTSSGASTSITTRITATTQGGVTSTSMTSTTRTTVPITTTCDNSSWIKIENRCFLFVTMKLDWIAASSSCHSMNGVLVTVFDQNDEKFLYGEASNVPFFIGLDDVANTGTWAWDQPIGKTLTLNDTKFTNWATGQPNTTLGDNYRCVVDQNDIGWTVSDCSIELNYVCEKPVNPIGSTTTQQQVSTTVASSTVSSKPVNITCGVGTWTNVENRCFTLANAGTNPFYIGLNDVAKPGTWLWDQPLGKTLTLNDTKFSNWAPGQPNITIDPNYRCVIDLNGTGWTVVDCASEQVFACEKVGSK